MSFGQSGGCATQVVCNECGAPNSAYCGCQQRRMGISEMPVPPFVRVMESEMERRRDMESRKRKAEQIKQEQFEKMEAELKRLTEENKELRKQKIQKMAFDIPDAFGLTGEQKRRVHQFMTKEYRYHGHKHQGKWEENFVYKFRPAHDHNNIPIVIVTIDSVISGSSLGFN